jgi:hypothetical protein
MSTYRIFDEKLGLPHIFIDFGLQLIKLNPLRTEVYFCHQNQNAKKYW